MLALVIDTSSAAVTAGLVRYGCGGPTRAQLELLAERVTLDSRGHAELLVPAIADCLNAAGAGPADIDAIVVGTGPGPFTGLRVGLMTAAAFADARNIATYGVCSLDAVAIAARGETPSERTASTPAPGRIEISAAASLLVATDARRKEVYFATYAGGVRTFGPAVDKPSQVIGSLPQPPTAMTGAGARAYHDDLGLPLLGADYPTVRGLALAAAERVVNRQASESLVPLYLRRPDAVVPTVRKTVTA